ncbi:MAG: LamB/YcsF family protein [Nocardioidaceae bacterium]|nr:LamB/YcsF family protein [Nocardioidaceae bacterium]
MAPTIDLMADIGESFGSWTMGDDARLLDALTSANVACGFHAGDPRTMETAVNQCVERGVVIGAHPGFPDLVGFGRRTVDLTRDEVRTDVLYQLGALQAFATAAGARLHHVSPHGRLGNLTVTDPTYADGVLDAIEQLDPSLVVVGQPGLIHELAQERGLQVGRLGFPDRAYEDDGALVSRREDGAVLHDVALIAERAVSLALHQSVVSRNGVEVSVACDSILLHGDNDASVAAAFEVRTALEAAGVRIAAQGG